MARFRRNFLHINTTVQHVLLVLRVKFLCNTWFLKLTTLALYSFVGHIYIDQMRKSVCFNVANEAKMALKSYIFLGYLVCTWMASFTSGIGGDFCIGDNFNPLCSDGEIIIMQSAQYGRMKENKCFRTDLGFLGCKTDVMAQFDRECSGKQQCEVFVLDRNIEAKGGCMDGLEVYLQASYICKKELKLQHQCATNHPSSVGITSPQSYLSSDELTTCTQQSKPFRLKAGDGQKLNISLINLQHESISDSVFGFIKETSTNRRVLFGGGDRHQHLLISGSNVVEIGTQASAHSDARFLLQIEVNGCPNLNPPEGAWMTRQDDVMEIGCHSGSKSWTLTCEKNQWIGAVGQCGRDQGSQNTDGDIEKVITGGMSINVMLFGVCSVIILFSSTIFLLGVCILKRKLKQTPVYSLPPNQMDAVFFPQYPSELLINANQDTMCKPIQTDASINVSQRPAEATYKSLQTREGNQNAPNVTGSCL